MTSISAFTFIHNAIDSGYPIVEAIKAVSSYVDEVIVVNMQSTDGTRELLETANSSRSVSDISDLFYKIKIIDGQWGNKAGETLRQAHSLYSKCSGDIIIHFEGDEVFDDDLLWNIRHHINEGYKDLCVYRLQLEQNFQRCRWYPELVHRVFPKDSKTIKEGHTTNRHNQSISLSPENGFLWDITNCFRDNWINRITKQAELRGEELNCLVAPIHITHWASRDYEHLVNSLSEPHWTWKTTPFNIPEVLKPLVGQVKYEPKF